MSYCLTASCMAHRVKIYWSPYFSRWVHAAGNQACEELRGEADPTELRCFYCGADLDADGAGRLFEHHPDAPGYWEESPDLPGRSLWRDGKWSRACRISPTFNHELTTLLPPQSQATG